MSGGIPFDEFTGPVELHPEIVEMDEGQVAVLAAIGRVPGTERFTDEQLASILLRLQEQGYVTLGATEDGEPFYRVNFEPEKARAEYEARRAQKPQLPSRRERRAKNRRKGR